MRGKIFVTIFVFSHLLLHCIDLNIPQSAVHNAVSGLSLIFSSPATAAVNPANISSGLETSATYLFNLRELPVYNLHFGYQFGSFGIHMGNSFLNHKLYRENLLEFTAAYRWKSFAAGFGINRLSVAVTDYESEAAIKFDAGFLYENRKFTTGFSVLNVLQTKCENELLPVVINWESCLKVSAKGKLAIGFEKENGFDFAFKFAARYDFFKSFSLLTGYQYNPARLGVGAVFGIGEFHLIYSVRTHQYLDLTHYISVEYEL